jgi:hypothetical protein
MSRRRRQRLTRTLVAGTFLVAAAVAVVVVVNSSSGPSGHSAAAASGGRHDTTTSAAPTTTTTSTTTTTLPPTTTTTDPGTLPQTDQFPDTSTGQFQAEMNDLWQGVVTGSVQPAMPAFFPESAYVQLKTIGGASSDWQNRLVADYGLDIQAAHALLGSDPSSAQLVSINVPAQYGHWVPPGACDNGIGYFELPNARVVYEVGGQQESFGIASMISWRGQWYVVHLGAILRSGSGGEVDDPESGPGDSAYSGTC